MILAGLASPLAGSEKGRFELVGKLIPDEPNMFKPVPATVSLQGVGTSFSSRTFADGKGEFKFKNLPPGMYTLTVALPRVRVLRRTVDIGPSFADEKGRIHLSVPFERRSTRRRYAVPATQLAVSEDALNEYRKALDHLEKGEPERATARLKKAVEIAPQFAGAWNMLGSVAFQSGQFDEAERCFREAVNHNPEFFRALVGLGGVLFARNKTKESLDAYLRALRLRPDDLESRARVGLNYFHLGEYDKAAEHLLEVRRTEPGHFSCPQIFLAQIFALRGQNETAITELEEFLKLHPDSEMIPSVRETIKQLQARLNLRP